MVAMTASLGSFECERAGPVDVPALLDLIHLSFAELARLNPPSGAAGENLASLATLMERGAVIKAVSAGNLVGCVTLEPKGDDLYLGRLAVRPDCRRLGIARALLAEAERFARAAGVAGLVLNVRLVLAGNIRLFEGAGFKITGQGSHPEFAVPTYHIMRKDLTF